MESLRVYDIYDFVDDGINESMYTILNKYHPFMKKDFSLGNMINHMMEVEQSETQEKSAKIHYEKYFTELADCLNQNTGNVRNQQTKSVSGEKRVEIFEELKAACEEIPECKDFLTIKAYTDFAKENIGDPKTKPLRDAIVNNAGMIGMTKRGVRNEFLNYDPKQFANVINCNLLATARILIELKE